jgi:threonine dehydratase
VIAETGATMIHPFENENVMAGQGTLAIELLEDVPDLDLILCPVGGGGVLSGTAVAAKSLRPGIKVIATEPAGADDAAQSFHEHRLVQQEKKNTIADGLRTDLGAPNFALIERFVDDVVTVSDDAIVQAMRAIWETMKIIVEPSGAVGYAAILEKKVDCGSKRIGIVLTGGNVDLDALPWMKF